MMKILKRQLDQQLGKKVFFGKTLLPGYGESSQNSKDDQIYVIINNGLSELGQAQSFSHEGYGHAAIYLETNSRKAAAHDFSIGARDNNRNLIIQIINSIIETTKNFKK